MIILQSPYPAGDPGSIASLQLWNENRAGFVFQDVAGTIAAAIGQPVALKKTMKAGLPDRSQATGSKQPTYDEIGVRFGASDILTGTAIALTGKFTVYQTGTCGRNQSGATAVQLTASSFPASHSGHQSILGVHFQTGGSQFGYFENDAGALRTATVTPWPGYYIARWRRDVTNQVRYRASGTSGEVSIGAALSGTVTFDSEGFVFGFNSSNQVQNTVLIFNDDLVATGEDPLVMAYLQRETGLAAGFGPAITRKLIIEGDSISCGNTTPGTALGWNNLILPLLTNGYRPSVYATGGTTMAGIKAAATYATYGPTMAAGDILTIMAGTNDSFSAQSYTDLFDWCTAAKAAIGSAKLLVCTGLPRYVSDTARQTFNTSIRNQSSPPWDGIVDWGSDALMGQAGQYSDTTYYADGVHPNLTGHQVGLAYWLAAFQALGA